MEMQGSLERVGSNPSTDEPEAVDDRRGLRIGQLALDGGKASIKIGNNTLQGKVETLKKPLVMLRKTHKVLPFSSLHGVKNINSSTSSAADVSSSSPNEEDINMISTTSTTTSPEGENAKTPTLREVATRPNVGLQCKFTDARAVNFEDVLDRVKGLGKKADSTAQNMQDIYMCTTNQETSLKRVKNAASKKPLGSQVMIVEAVIRRKCIFTTRPAIRVPAELVKHIVQKDGGKKKKK